MENNTTTNNDYYYFHIKTISFHEKEITSVVSYKATTTHCNIKEFYYNKGLLPDLSLLSSLFSLLSSVLFLVSFCFFIGISLPLWYVVILLALHLGFETQFSHSQFSVLSSLSLSFSSLNVFLFLHASLLSSLYGIDINNLPPLKYNHGTDQTLISHEDHNKVIHQ